MAKLNSLFDEELIVTSSFRTDSADSKFRTDNVDRVDLIGGIVNDGQEGEWFEDYSNEWKKFDYTPLKKNDDGFLVGRAVATTIGVFSYRREDGSIRKELRAPEHVFHPDSLATLKMTPLTNNHPTERVTADNRDKYSVGNLGENVVQDQLHGFVSVPLSIQQKDAVSDVEGGKRGLSCGYTTDVVERPGVWGGVRYDAIQTNIRYNHLAIVDEGRAGDDAVLKMDGVMMLIEITEDPDKDEGKDGCAKHKRKSTSKTKKDTGGKRMERKIDGITLDGDDKLFEHLDAAVDRAEKAESAKQTADEALDTAQKESETLQGKFDQAEKTIEELNGKLDNSVSKDDIEAYVAEAKKLDDAIEQSEAKVDASASELDKKKAVIIALDSSAKEDLEGKSDAFIEGAFEMAVKKLDGLQKADKKNATKLKTEPAPKADGKEPEKTPEQKLDVKLRNKYKGDK